MVGIYSLFESSFSKLGLQRYLKADSLQGDFLKIFGAWGAGFGDFGGRKHSRMIVKLAAPCNRGIHGMEILII